MAKMTAEQVMEKYVSMLEENDNNLFGEAAINVGKRNENRDYMSGGGFKDGDIVTISGKTYVPSVRQKDGTYKEGKHLCAIATVKRGDDIIAMTVYPAWLTNSVHKLVTNSDGTIKVDADGKPIESETEFWHHEGKPTEVARSIQGYETDIWERFNGCTIKVKKTYQRDCLVFPRGTTNYDPSNMIAGKRKFYSYEWVKDTQNEDGATE